MQLPPDAVVLCCYIMHAFYITTHDAMAGVTLLTSMCTAFGPYVCNYACVYIYMLCKYEPRYGYMSACIPISIDFSNSLIVAQFGLLFF